MPGWLWALIAALTAVLGLVVIANLGAAEKKITQRVVEFCAVADPAFRRTVAGLFGPQYLGGNAIETLVNGDRIFPAMLAAIDGAERSINFETFIYWSGEVGQHFADSLAARARAGVEVNILLDWVGSQRMDERLLRAFYRGLLFSRDNPEESIKIVEREWKLDPATARDSYQSIMKAASRDGASSDAGLRVHVKLMQQADKSIGDIALSKIVDFRILEEVRKEIAR